MVCQQPECVQVLMRCEELKCADSDMALRYPGQQTARLCAFAYYPFAAGDRSQDSGAGNAQCRHCFADDILAQYRAERSTSVAIAGVGGSAAALELDIVTRTISANDLTEQNCPPISQLGTPATKLMTGVNCGDGI